MSGPRRENPDHRDTNTRKSAARDFTEFGFAEPGGSDALDAYLDGELDRSSPRFRAKFVGDGSFRSELAASEEMISALKRSGGEPDLSADILARVHAAKPFARAERRRLVGLSKLAIAASAVVGVGGLAMLERTHPTSTPWAPQETPLGDVVAQAEGPRPAVGAQIRAAATKFMTDSKSPVAKVPWSGYVVDSFEVRRRCAGHSTGEGLLASADAAGEKHAFPGPSRLLRSPGSLDVDWSMTPLPIAMPATASRFAPAAPPLPEIVPSWGSPLSVARLGSLSDQYFVTFP